MDRLLRIALCLMVIASPVAGQSSATSAGPGTQSDDRYRDPDALYQLISEGMERYVLVDVRTAAEYSGGHIPTALNIPYDAIGKAVPTEDTSELIIVYCASGARSAAARRTLDALGYRRVVDFGSISRWKGALDTSTLPGDAGP